MPGLSPHRGPDPQLSTRRAARLYRLLKMMDKGARTRAQLLKLGRAGVRTFYRDLTYLQDVQIEVRIFRGRYELATPLDRALGQLPFPTPHLSFADVMELAKGTGPAHKKLKRRLYQLIR